MAMIVNLEIPHNRYSEIEEYCVNRAIGIPEYFLILHELNMLHGTIKKYETDERMNNFHRKFESMARNDNQPIAESDEKVDLLNKETLQNKSNDIKSTKTRKKS